MDSQPGRSCEIDFENEFDPSKRQTIDDFYLSHRNIGFDNPETHRRGCNTLE